VDICIQTLLTNEYNDMEMQNHEENPLYFDYFFTNHHLYTSYHFIQWQQLWKSLEYQVLTAQFMFHMMSGTYSLTSNTAITNSNTNIVLLI